MNLKDYIVDVPNYPKEGILFKDIMLIRLLKIVDDNVKNP